ncbi:MAG: Chaperone SurA [Elusimicrobia bacterium]|nr:Chaperone SurA [Elusimicrobiota bacterium]
MKFQKFTGISIGIIFCGYSMGFSETIGKSIATVNGEAIFSGEFENNFEALLEQQKKMAPAETPTTEWKNANKKLLLDQMIEEKLLLQEANKKKIVVPKRQLEEGILQVKNRFKTLSPGAKPTKEDFERELTPNENKEFLEELKQQGITEKEFENKINDQLKVLRLTEDEIRSKVAIPVKENSSAENEPKELTPQYEKEARELYAEIEKKFTIKDFKPDPDNEIDQIVEVLKSKLGESIHARHILVKSERTDDFKKRQAALAKAQAIKKELDKGADFIDLANKKSEGPSSKNGGDLGFFSRGQMTPEFEKAAFGLPVGGISDVVETEFGYHIIMVEEKKAAKRLRFDDIKLDLAGYLYQKQMKDRYDQYVSELRKKADIKILLNLEGEKG